MFKRCVFICTCLLIFSFNSQAQDIALGLRLGDPLGLSFKKYLNGGNNAFEATIGTYGYAGVYGYNPYGPSGRYKGRYYYHKDYYYRSGGAVIMANYLWNFDFPKTKELSWYLSVGGQLRSLYYLRRDRNGFYEEEVRGVGIGPNASIGLEWIPKELPEIGLFLDAGLYLEIAPAAWAIPQVGVGVRYNFK